MSPSILQLLVLAGIALFLILRLRSALGTREGYEKPPVPRKEVRPGPVLDVIEGSLNGPDRDIIDHVDEGTGDARALAHMKRAEPDFNVSEFLSGARQAYEFILMGFEKGDIDSIASLLDDDVEASFREVVSEREAQGLHIDATFIGVAGVDLQHAEFDEETRMAEVTVRFVGELTSSVRNASGEVVDGDPKAIVRQRDTWTFARCMGSTDPNWQLVATGE